MKIAFKDKTSSLISLIAFLCAQATTILTLWHKNSTPVCKMLTHHLMPSLTKLRRDGRAWWVGSFKFSSNPYGQKKLSMQLELGDDCAHVEQSGHPRVLLSLSALPLTLTNVKLLFFHGSGGMSLVGLAQAPSSALAALTSDCQSPKLAMIAACLSTSACCHPTPVLVGCFRNA